MAKVEKGQRLAADLVLRAKLAAGGQGEVWEAEDLTLRRSVAVKLLHPLAATSPSVRGRFEREAQVLSALDHPGLVRVLRYDLDAPRPWFAMDLADGSSLAAILAQKTAEKEALTAPWVRHVALQLGDALAFAHARGIVHRDIKPANIMVGSRIRLVDFGVLKLLSDSATQATTAMRGPIGTLTFFAPEQLESRPVTVQTDIHALGVLFYTMLAGRSPWDEGAGSSAERRSRIIEQILSPARPRARSVRPELSPALDEILRRAMALEPSKRHADVRDFTSELAEALGEATIVEGTLPTGLDLRRPRIAPTLDGAPDDVPTVRPAAQEHSPTTRSTVIPALARPMPELTNVAPIATEHHAPTSRAPARSAAWPIALTVWGLVVLALLVFLIGEQRGRETRPPPEVPLPARSPAPVEPKVEPTMPVLETPAPTPPPALPPSPPPTAKPADRSPAPRRTPVAPPRASPQDHRQAVRAIVLEYEQGGSPNTFTNKLKALVREQQLGEADQAHVYSCLNRFNLVPSEEGAHQCGQIVEELMAPR